jgi:hypothetical protein
MPAKDYLRFDEIEDVLSSLSLLALVAGLIRKQPSYWKWMIVAAHDALQGAMVCALSGTSDVGALDEKSIRETLEWLDTQQGQVPEERHAYFKTLVARCLHNSHMDGEPLVLNVAQLKDISRLHDHFRNNFSHFTPKSWSIEKAGLPRIIGTAIDCIEDLMGKTQVLFKLTGNRKRRLSKNIKEIRTYLAKI